VAPKKAKKSDADEILRKYYEQYDDDMLESLKRYFNLGDSDQDKFLRYLRNNHMPPTDD
jgi:hypothetical protein